MRALVPALILGSVAGLACFTDASANERGRETATPARTPVATTATTQTTSASSPTARQIVYNPPRRGAPRTRTGGGTRTAGQQQVAIEVLAPEDTGLTTSDQPTLYWQLSSDTNGRFEFVLSDETEVAPLLRTVATEPLAAGVHAIRLAESDVKLVPGVVYRWSVALVRDPAQRSNDIVSSATVEVVDVPPELRAELERSTPQERPAIYAAHGLWYDAVHALNLLIDQQPGDASLSAQRDSLLAQAGIDGRVIR